MSRHKVYRNYDFENDLDEFDGENADVDFDDDYDDDTPAGAGYGNGTAGHGASGSDASDGGAGAVDPDEEAENIQKLQDATDAVIQRLGDKAARVRREQIQESVWYYYFDVDKATAYLTRKFIDPPTPPPEKKPKKEQPVSQNAPTATPPPVSSTSSTPNTSADFAAFFADMPWLHVPAARQTVFVAPSLPRGGLLGGASNSAPPPKMSKLQALAAQRKRKAEEAKNARAGASAGTGGGTAREATPGGGNASQTAEQERELRAKSARLSLGASSPGASAAPAPAPALIPEQNAAQNECPRDDESSFAMEGVRGPGPDEDTLHSKPRPLPGVSLLAAPSAFAQALFGPRQQKSARGPEEAFLAVPSLSRAPESAFEAFLEPSPDDQVLAAQAKAFKKKSKPNGASKDDANTATASLTSGVKALKVDDTPLPRSKNLDVLSEYRKSNAKPNLSFVVVGHVDSGKSTMMGRLLLDRNEVAQHTIDRFQREASLLGKSSFALAWVLDQGTDEREHGVTIDIATRHFETERVAFTLLDAPGHRDFIPNMIAGASQADLAVLVVDASPGEFESGLKGQTREHALLLRSMGLSRLIVAVNKLDKVGWSQERFDEITQQVSGFLKVTGFPMNKISYVPVSGLRGDNLVTRSTDPAAAWYTGGTLVEELEQSEPPSRALVAPLRLQISEAFRTAASAITVGGRIAAGSLQMGDAVLVQPAGQKAYIKALLRESEPADWAVAGHNVLLHLTGIDPDHVRAGDVLCDPNDPAVCVDAFSIKALAFDVLFPMPVEVHRGRLNEPGMVRELTALLHKNTGEVTKRRPKLVKPGHVARLQVTLSSKLPLERGQRLVLRSAGQTVAAGLLE